MGEKVVLYTIDCPKCKILERKLSEASIVFDTVKDTDLMRSKGYLMLPVLEVDSQVFDFAKAVNWVKEHN